MPADNQEVLDDFIMDMDIETITLDDMQVKETDKGPDTLNAEMALNEQANNQFFGDLKMDKVNIEEIKLDSLGGTGGKSLVGGDGQNVTINIEHATIQGDVKGNLKDETPMPEPVAVKTKTPKAEKKSVKIDDVPDVEVPDFGEIAPIPEPVSMDKLDQEFLRNVESDITLGDLNRIEETPEPSLPIEPSLDVYPGIPESAQAPVPDNPEADVPKSLDDIKDTAVFSSEDDIIFIDGNELDKILYGKTPPQTGDAGIIDNITVIEETPVEEPEEIGPISDSTEHTISIHDLAGQSGKETVPLAEEIITEEVPVSSLDMQPLDEGIITESEGNAEQPVLELEEKVEDAVPELNIDLSAIPDVGQVEEDEPIALSMDELNNIDISDESVMGFNATDILDQIPAGDELPPDDEKIEISLDELNEIQKDISTLGPREDRARFIEQQLENLSGQSKDELKSVLAYLDRLLEDLPEDKIKEFAKSDYYDLYVKILDKLGV